MPYEQKAPNGKFRVISVGMFGGGGRVEGDFDTLEKAQKHSEKIEGEQMLLKMYIYDDTGRCYDVGTF